MKGGVFVKYICGLNHNYSVSCVTPCVHMLSILPHVHVAPVTSTLGPE